MAVTQHYRPLVVEEDVSEAEGRQELSSDTGVGVIRERPAEPHCGRALQADTVLAESSVPEQHIYGLAVS
ncbi:unnamed protein product [Merluccius merluccius]